MVNPSIMIKRPIRLYIDRIALLIMAGGRLPWRDVAARTPAGDDEPAERQ